MEFSELFSFLIIVKETIQILPKIWFHLLSITAISMALPSAFFLVFWYIWKTLADATTADSGITYLTLLLSAEMLFLFILIAGIRYSAIATILVSSTSYTGSKLSFTDLVSKVKAARGRPPMSPRFHLKSTLGIILLVAMTAVVLIMDLISPVTICLLVIFWIVLIIFRLKWSVAWMMALVVAVVEEGYEGWEAIEKGEELVEGEVLKGFMLNLFVNGLGLVGFLGFWLVFVYDGLGAFNLMIYILVFINVCSVLRICVCVMYTVFYVQCKRLHGEDIDVITADFQYAKLPTSAAGDD